MDLAVSTFVAVACAAEAVLEMDMGNNDAPRTVPEPFNHCRRLYLGGLERSVDMSPP